MNYMYIAVGAIVLTGIAILIFDINYQDKTRRREKKLKESKLQREMDSIKEDINTTEQ